MHYMLCRHEVEDYARWRRVFDSHAEAHREAGLHLLHLLRDTANPNMVVFLFRIDEPAKARAFVESPKAGEGKVESGVIGTPEIMYLEE